MHAAARRLIVAACSAALPLPLLAQRAATSDAEWLDNCRNNNWGDDRGRACEVRDVAVRPSGRALEVDGRENGSIRVQAWDGDAVKVTARLQANASSDAEAQALLKDIRITSDGKRISADGPREYRNHSGWSTSYVVMVPRHFDLTLDAHNGSLGVDGVNGRLDLRTVNGSVQLADVGGEVHARTQNGSLNVQLAGRGWDGSGLDAETQNGSVRLMVPENYAANLETGTVNGRINTDFPITVQGRISRQLNVPLNGGGKTIRATTTNGSVRISRR